METLIAFIGLISTAAVVIFGVLLLMKLILNKGRLPVKRLGIMLGTSFAVLIIALLIPSSSDEAEPAKPSSAQLEREELNIEISDLQEAYIAEDYEGALSKAKNILADHPDNEKASSLKVKAEQKVEEIQITKLIDSAEGSMQAKDYSLAIIDYDRALEINPDDAKVQELKSIAVKKQDEAEKIEEEKALKEEEARIARQKEKERKENEARIAKQKENERKVAEAKAQKEKQQRASAAQNSNSSSSSNNSSAGQAAESPANCDIKGSVNGIYHTPGSTYYSRTKNVVQWFCTPQEAVNAGYRAPER